MGDSDFAIGVEGGEKLRALHDLSPGGAAGIYGEGTLEGLGDIRFGLRLGSVRQTFLQRARRAEGGADPVFGESDFELQDARVAVSFSPLFLQTARGPGRFSAGVFGGISFDFYRLTEHFYPDPSERGRSPSVGSGSHSALGVAVSLEGRYRIYRENLTLTASSEIGGDLVLDAPVNGLLPSIYFLLGLRYQP